MENLRVLGQRMRVYAAKGQKDKARAAIDQAVQSLAGANAAAAQAMVRAQMEITLSCCYGDIAGYLKQAAQVPEGPVFEPLLLRGKLEEAAARITDADTDEVALKHALVYLGAVKAKKAKLAEEQWQKFLKGLGKGGHEERRLAVMIAGREPINPDVIRRVPIEPQIKRVLTAVAAQRDPGQAKELLELARKLDFYRDATSMCLWSVVEEKS